MLSTEPVFALDASHPNYVRWQRAIDTSLQRGHMVCDLLSEFVTLSDCTVLDAGCGVGGTSMVLHERGADVIAVDRNPARLEALERQSPDIDMEEAELEALPFPDESFDCIILQDVIEHVRDPQAVLNEAARTLLPEGILYISTPNRQSLLNYVSDPHWGLPFAARMNREKLRGYLTKRRPDDAARDDLAQLLSYSDLEGLLASVHLEPVLLQRQVVDIMFTDPRKVVWSDLHLNSVKFVQWCGMDKVVRYLINDEPGLVNTWLSPSWYMVCRKAHV